MGRRAFLIESLRQYKTMAELRQSEFFADHREQIESLLNTPQIFSCPGANPRIHSFFRIAQWNIEKGKRFDAILDRLRSDEILQWADVIILNEADHGMNRSQNRHVARVLAQALGMHMAFAPAHFELTKGTDDELTLEGDNQESLQGNAILSRYPILEASVVPLPVTFEPYEFHEKRYGRRNCLWVRIQLRESVLWVGAVHLELRNTATCRARQMVHIMSHLPGRLDEAYLLGGDLNRGTFGRTIRSVLRLAFSPASGMKELLLHPERGSEPLFAVAKRHGFAWEGFNSHEETARTAIDSLEEACFLPKPLISWIKTRLAPYDGFLCFKLDWFLGKRVQALSGGQRRDNGTGIVSVGPSCVKGENASPTRASDHLPIYADLDMA
jgi:endonuclease/exonuclease/phosphatase family metal-dependent hydrolase